MKPPKVVSHFWGSVQFPVHAVTVDRKIIRRENGGDNNRRVDGRRRVGGLAADAVIVTSKIIRHDIGADNNRRVGGEARGRLGLPYDLNKNGSRGSRFYSCDADLNQA